MLDFGDWHMLTYNEELTFPTAMIFLNFDKAGQ